MKALVRRRPGSKNQQLEAVLLPRAQVSMATPTNLTIYCSSVLPFPVDRKMVWKILHQNNHTLKGESPIPSLSVPWERRLQALHYQALWSNNDQWVFCDEKKFHNKEIGNRAGARGYSLVGTRLNRAQLTNHWNLHSMMPSTVEVIAAISLLPHHLHLPLRDGRNGTVGLIASKVVHNKLNVPDILHFIQHILCPTLTPYPGPRSLVVLDNLGRHRMHAAQIRHWINLRGAFLIWNPARSPDMNVIEKYFDVSLSVSVVLVYFQSRIFFFFCCEFQTCEITCCCPMNVFFLSVS